MPVWHDRSDLPPGDTERRLAEALESGLSGAVLLVTPGIEHSRVVREVELPQLLELEGNEAFTLSVLSTIESGPGKLDYDAPDRLLAQPSGTLGRLKQELADTPRQRADAARAQCQRRMQAIRRDVEAADEYSQSTCRPAFHHSPHGPMRTSSCDCGRRPTETADPTAKVCTTSDCSLPTFLSWWLLPVPSR